MERCWESGGLAPARCAALEQLLNLSEPKSPILPRKARDLEPNSEAHLVVTAWGPPRILTSPSKEPSPGKAFLSCPSSNPLPSPVGQVQPALRELQRNRRPEEVTWLTAAPRVLGHSRLGLPAWLCSAPAGWESGEGAPSGPDS